LEKEIAQEMNQAYMKKNLLLLKRTMAAVAVVFLVEGTAMAGVTMATPATAASADQTSAAQPETGPFDWLSNIPIHLSLNETTYYDDNIFVSPHKTRDYVFDITPTLTYEFGKRGESDNYLSLSYAPTLIKYYHHANQDALDQNANILYEHHFEKLTLGLGQSYLHTFGASIEAGGLINSDIYTTNATGDYDYSDKLKIKANFTQTISTYPDPGNHDISEWAGGVYFLYQITPKISLGFGPRVGTVDIQMEPSQTYEQGLVHATYSVTQKITVQASGGVEDRQYDANVSDKIYGVYDLGVYYTPFDGTTVSLNGYRRNTPSFSLNGVNYTATGGSLGVKQKFLDEYTIGTNAGLENDAYTAAATGTTSTRNDNYFYARPYFQWDAQDWLQLMAYYQYSKNESTTSGIGFNDSQVGGSVTLKY